ncbi:MAG: carboxypeptidase M32, partial [Candidatus Hodarchaeales archaeon]
MTVLTAYNELLKQYEEFNVLEQIESILNWDFETYMPSKGVDQRSKQLARIASLKHKQITNPKIGELLNEIQNDSDYSSLSDIQKRNVYLVKRKYEMKVKIPRKLVEEIARQKIIAIDTWKKAKKIMNYAMFKPELDKLLNLFKQRAHYLNPAKEPFDVFLDEYEPGMTSEMITNLFDKVKKGLLPLIKNCLSSNHQPDLSVIKRYCSIEIQKKLSADLAKLVHYDIEERGRIDETEHPFATGSYDDVRITTHYYENDFVNSFYSVLHEAGHGLYDQNLPRDYVNQPIGNYSSLGIHESQSRFLENIIGRSHEFWEFYLPRLKELSGKFDDVNLDSIVLAINQVKPSKIRITADEVTYSLHVIIRFEIEYDLLSGKI